MRLNFLFPGFIQMFDLDFDVASTMSAIGAAQRYWYNIKGALHKTVNTSSVVQCDRQGSVLFRTKCVLKTRWGSQVDMQSISTNGISIKTYDWKPFVLQQTNSFKIKRVKNFF